MHPFCGKFCGEEGYGQPVWCSVIGKCSLSLGVTTDSDCYISSGESDSSSSSAHDQMAAGSEFSPKSAKPSSEIPEDFRTEIWQHHQQHPKMSQKSLCKWARNRFGLASLTQSSVSRILAKFREGAAKTGNLTNEQVQQIYNEFLSRPKISQKDLAKWAKAKFNLQRLPSQSTISRIISKKRCAIGVPKNDLNLKRKRVSQKLWTKRL